MLIKNLSAFVCGLLFSLGLILGGMLDPVNILAFLTFSKNWNPSLIYVLGGAVCVTFCAVRLQKHVSHPLLESSFQLPATSKIDKSLIIGSCLFGLGWALVGLCPGPAITSLVTGHWQSWIFLLGLLLGMKAFSSWELRLRTHSQKMTVAARQMAEKNTVGHLS